MKFYFAQFKHKRSKRSLYKFGITKHMDANKRFSVSESKKFGRSPKQYADFDIKILASIPCKSGKEAHALEQKFLSHFTKTVALEYYFKESKAKYKDMSGVTELRQMSYDDLQEAFKMINDATPSHVRKRKQLMKAFYDKARGNKK